MALINNQHVKSGSGSADKQHKILGAFNPQQMLSITTGRADGKLITTLSITPAKLYAIKILPMELDHVFIFLLKSLSR